MLSKPAYLSSTSLSSAASTFFRISKMLKSRRRRIDEINRELRIPFCLFYHQIIPTSFLWTCCNGRNIIYAYYMDHSGLTPYFRAGTEILIIISISLNCFYDVHNFSEQWYVVCIIYNISPKIIAKIVLEVLSKK